MYLLAVQLLFGSWPVVGRILLRNISGPALVGVRATCAAVIFMVVAPKRRLTGRQHLRAMAAGVLGITANQMFFIAGLERTSAVNSAVLITTIPVFTLLVSVATGAERFNMVRAAGVALALCGALFVTGAARAMLGVEHAVGNLLLLCGAASYATYLVVVRPLAETLGAAAVVPWVFFYGALTCLPLAVPSALAAGPLTVTPVMVALLAFVVAGPTVGTYFLNAVALRQAPPSLVAVYIYLQPLVAGLLAAPVLGERPSLTLLVGAVPIFAGVWVTTRARG